MIRLYKKISTRFSSALAVFSGLLFFPSFVYAHEVYVLGRDTVERDVGGISPNPFSMVAADMYHFSLWSLIAIITVLIVFLISLSKRIEILAGPFFLKAKKLAPFVGRLTLAVCFLACAYYRGLFGPELPFSDFVGAYAGALSILFYLLGVSFFLGLYVRESALIALGIFALSIFHYGTYMFTYTNYLGEMLLNLILGAGMLSLDGNFARERSILDIVTLFKPYAFLILRVLFGFSVLFASFYAKFFHSQLALDTVVGYHLTNYFHFAPLFVVLGAFIIEAIIGIFFIIGFEIRFAAAFFLFFLALSLLYFGEAVWPHLILLGVNVVFLFHGPGDFSLESFLRQRSGLKPAL